MADSPCTESIKFLRFSYLYSYLWNEKVREASSVKEENKHRNVNIASLLHLKGKGNRRIIEVAKIQQRKSSLC